MPSVDIAAATTRGGVIFRNGKRELLEKLKALRPVDPLTQPVFIAPSAWSPSTAYIKGEAVANGGNWYVCTVAGTSAGSGGPSGTDTTMIVDGTVKWQFFSPARAVTTVDAPTIATTTSAPGDLTTQVNIGGGGWSKKFDISTAFGVQDNGAGNIVPTVTLPRTPVSTTGDAIWEFMTDAPRFSFQTYYCAAYRILVDGVSVTIGDYKTAGPTADAYVTLDFGSVRRPRRITIIGAENPKSVRITAVDRIWSPSPPPLRGVFIGDSWGAGAAPGPSRRGDQMGNHMARFLGIGEAIANSSVGGTGFNATNGSTAYNYLQRMTLGAATVAADKPLDFVLLQGSGNDIGTAADAALQAQYLACLQKARELWPYATIVMTEIVSTLTPANSGVITTNALLRAAFDQFADPNSAFVPISSTNTREAQAWIGTDNSATYIGDGGDLHPRDAGHLMFGRRLAAGLRYALAA